MARFTKELRQEIVREFAERNGGHYDPRLFVEEVQSKGQEHPAYGWFEWDRAKAALAFQVEQAREFARDLRVSFTIENATRSPSVRVLMKAEMPLVLSPIAERQNGGGYYLTDPDNPEHMAEHCRQAAQTLGTWLNRYRSALEHAGYPARQVEAAISALQAKSLPAEAAA